MTSGNPAGPSDTFIVRTDTFEVPFTIKLTQLIGPDDLDDWKDDIKSQLTLQDLWGHVSGDTPRPVDENLVPQWNKKNIIAYRIIKQTIDRIVLSDMRNVGWDSGAFDPKKTYNIAVQT